MTKQELQEQAVKLFGIHKGVDQLILTSDGQAFTEEHYAQSHAIYLKDKSLHTFNRHNAPEQEVEKVDEDTDREQLLAEYEVLFGKKAPHNISTENLAKKIAEENENQLKNDNKDE